MAYEANWELNEELAAVNDVLSAIGESPVQTLEGDANADVVNARRILNKINMQVQSRGWTFNIDENVSLQPDIFSKLIPYLPSYLQVQSTGGTVYNNRGGYVYDRINRTDQFESAIVVNIISLRSFEEMPSPFRNYIVTKAARQFNMRYFGAPEIEAALQLEEQEMYQLIQEYEMDYGAYNMLQQDPFVSGAVGR